MIYLTYFVISAILAAAITPIIRRIAIANRVLDIPTSPRKIHKSPIPLMGGVAVFTAFLVSLFIYLQTGNPDFHIIPQKFFLAIIFGGLILVVGGILDDKYVLPPKILWLFPAVASLVVVLSGIGVGIKELSNPFGNPINLDYIILGLPFSGIVMWIWMMGMIFTTKFLDGLDGLCSGISLIGGLTLFALSLTSKVNQPMTAALAIIFSGALFGYMFYAYNPASIFLGEAGSTFLGFMLGLLSIILGGKIATALLVMGIPILDVAWQIIRRLWYGSSPFVGDRKHLHFRLLDLGFTQKQTVWILWGISAIFGFTAVFLQSLGKLIALIILFLLMLGLAITTVIIYKSRNRDLFDTVKK